MEKSHFSTLCNPFLCVYIQSATKKKWPGFISGAKRKKERNLTKRNAKKKKELKNVLKRNAKKKKRAKIFLKENLRKKRAKIFLKDVLRKKS